MSAQKPGQVFEKPCVRSRGQIFSPIIMKLCQNVGLDEISNDLEYGSCRVKNQVTTSNLRKALCRGHIFSLIIIKLDQLVCPDEISHKFENGPCAVKN